MRVKIPLQYLNQYNNSIHKLRKEPQTALSSHAVGMAVAQPLDFKIDFARNPIS